MCVSPRPTRACDLKYKRELADRIVRPFLCPTGIPLKQREGTLLPNSIMKELAPVCAGGGSILRIAGSLPPPLLGIAITV